MELADLIEDCLYLLALQGLVQGCIDISGGFLQVGKQIADFFNNPDTVADTK